MPGCPFPTGYFKIGESKIPAPCKQWTCPHCGPIKKNKLLDRITTGATIRSVQDGGYRLRFMTLPLSPTVNEYLSLTQAWAQFRANAWKSGYRIRHYFWTRERTKAGAWHMHVCINVFVPWQRIQHWWRLATGCYVTDISAVDAGTNSKNGRLYGKIHIEKPRYGKFPERDASLRILKGCSLEGDSLEPGIEAGTGEISNNFRV
jgi:hypothetical protein